MGAPVVAPTPCTNTAVLVRYVAVRARRRLDGAVASPRERRVGGVLFLERRASRPAVGLVLQRRDLHDHWLRRYRAAERVATPWWGRGADGHPDVRLVDRILLHDLHSPVRTA